MERAGGGKQTVVDVLRCSKCSVFNRLLPRDYVELTLSSLNCLEHQRKTAGSKTGYMSDI